MSQILDRKVNVGHWTYMLRSSDFVLALEENLVYKNDSLKY